MTGLTSGKTRPVRLADIAKAAGVSHGTASNVFAVCDGQDEHVNLCSTAAGDFKCLLQRPDFFSNGEL